VVGVELTVISFVFDMAAVSFTGRCDVWRKQERGTKMIAGERGSSKGLPPPDYLL
jgi:hypothetical protein